MSHIDPQVWTRLANERVQGETLWARRAAPEITERLVGALDADGKRHLLILLRTSEAEVQDSQSRGVGVVTRELAVPGHEAGRYLDVTCHDPAGQDAFDLIGGELAERLSSGRETAAECVLRVLAKWRRFWGQLPRQILSREEQLGLFAELWFLSVWLIPRIGTAEAVVRWRGPFASRHDFEWTGHSVEVKATTSTRGRIHRVNGLDQLAPPELGELLFFSLRLREEGGATNTLPLIVAACRDQLESDSDSLSSFERALAQVGYSPAHDEEYARLPVRVVEERLFRVRADFPRLTVSQLSAGVPSGIERVEYEINLSGFDHLCIARNSTDALDL
jgi:Putative  PD-(D/E)XK family member, (DUF4420)